MTIGSFAKFASMHGETWPQTAKLLLLCALVASSNAGPERLQLTAAFSRLTKSSRGRRSTISCKTVDATIRVQELGDPIHKLRTDLRTNEIQVRVGRTLVSVMTSSGGLPASSK